MLEARDISVSYGAVRAVRSVSVDVVPGELVAVLGANGAGKTSTLAAISGLVPHGGDVTVDGALISTPVDAWRAGVAHVPQGRGLFRRLTVAQNLALGAYGRSPARVEASIQGALERLPELARWLPRSLRSLSGGEQALVALGRLLVAQPRYALLDEPTLGLAPVAVDRLYAEIARLTEAGIGVLAVEQYAPRALAVADRVVVIERGAVSFAGTPAGAGSAEDLVSAYLTVAAPSGSAPHRGSRVTVTQGDT